MSYILDALRKAERDRKLGQPPTVMAIVGESREQKKARPGLWILLILAFNAGVFFLLWPTERIEQAVSNPQASVPKPEVAVDFAARVSLVEQPLVVSEPPVFHALPIELRKELQLPPLNLDIHVYSELPHKRFVLINSVRYQQGDWLNEGPLLEAITQQGVILNHREQRFRLLVQQ